MEHSHVTRWEKMPERGNGMTGGISRTMELCVLQVLEIRFPQKKEVQPESDKIEFFYKEGLSGFSIHPFRYFPS